MGETLLDFESDKQDIKTITLQKNHIIETRNKFRFLDDRDEFKIK